MLRVSYKMDVFVETSLKLLRSFKLIILGDKPLRFTLEPFIFLLWFGHTTVYGAGIGVDLLILKVCHYELGFNVTVCKNLKAPENDAAEAEVQKMVNDFEMVRDWVYNAPPIFFSLIAGALSDRFGRKPLIVFPAIGFFLRSCSSIFIYAFLKELPLEIFILEEIDCFFGGLAVFSIGIYGFGATITDEHDRGSTLVRYDGIKTLSQIMGTALSPFIFSSMGFYGSYFFRFGLTLAALIHLIIVIKEPLKEYPSITAKEIPEKQEEDRSAKNCIRTPLRLFKEYIVDSAVDTIKTLFRRREGNLRALIFAQILIGACYRFSSANYTLTYLYMKRVFEAEQHHYALLKSVLKGLQCFCLLVITPFILKKGMHEAVYCGIVTAISSLALFLSAGAGDVWKFICARWLLLFRSSKHGPGKALLTRTCHKDEITKILAVNSLVAYAVPYVALPTMRTLYNKYLETPTPYIYILLAGAVLASSSVLNFILFAHKKEFLKQQQGDETDLDGEEVKAEAEEQAKKESNRI